MNTKATSRKGWFREVQNISCDSLDVTGFFSESDDEPQASKTKVEKKATADVKKHKDSISERILDGVQRNTNVLNNHIVSSSPLPGKEFIYNTSSWPSPIHACSPLLEKDKSEIVEGCKDKASNEEIGIISSSSSEQNELISKKGRRLKRKKTVSKKLKTNTQKRYPQIAVRSGPVKFVHSHKTVTKSGGKYTDEIRERVSAELNQTTKDTMSSVTKSNLKSPGYRIKSNILSDEKLQLRKHNEYDFIHSENEKGKETNEERTLVSEKPNLKRNKKLSIIFSKEEKENGATTRETSKRPDKISDAEIQRSPEKMSGVRRSQRQRVKPVAFWIGERILYKTSANFCREIVGIKPGVPAGNWKGPPKYSARVKKLVRVLDSHKFMQPDNTEQLPRRKLIKIPHEGTECEIECFSTPRFELDNTQDENFSVITCLEVPGMISGYVELGPFFDSEEQIIPSNMNLLFCIISGNLVVKIHNVTRSMGKNELFFIPKGVFYKLHNTSRNKTLLTYTKYEN